MKFKFKIPRQVVILGLISFFTDFASEMLYPVVPIFLTSVLGASMSIVGLIEGVAEVLANLLKGFFGIISDKIKKRAIFVKTGYSLSALVKPLPGFFPYVSIVAIARSLDRIGKGIRTSPRDALIAAEANDKNKGTLFGFHRSLDTLGAVAGPLTALLILAITNENYRAVFYFSIIPSLGAIYFAFKTKDKFAGTVNKTFYNFKEFVKNSPSNIKRLLLLVTIFSLVNSSDVFLILRVKNIFASDSYAIWAYLFYNLIYAVFSFPAGILSDKFSKRIVFATGLLIFSIVYFLFATSVKLFVIAFAFVLYGFYSATTDGILKGWISDFIGETYRASAIGIFNLFMGIAMMLSSIITGILWDAFGPEIPFLISSVVSFIVGILVFISPIVRRANEN